MSPVPAAIEALAPATQTDRISSIDVLRGFALLGIAPMNILFSGLPLAADWNPTISGGSTGANLVVFFIEFIFLHGKMRGLFSMMFGASAYLLLTRLDSKGAGLRAAQIYTSRILWLMLFGVVHAYLIWHGDILYPYALLGLILVPLIALRPRTLLIAAGIMLLLMTGYSVRGGFETIETHDLALQAEKAEAAGQPLTDQQKEAKRSWEQQRKSFYPSEKDLKEEREMYSGSYFHLLAKRAAKVKEWHSVPFYMSSWDMLTMMLVGIAFMKSGVLSAQRSPGFYWKLLLYSCAFGLPVGTYSAFKAWATGFDPMRTVLTLTSFPATRAAMTLGAMSAMLLLYKAGAMQGMLRRLAAIGQTALSNYILHSFIYGFVFYGYGLNLFDKLQRWQLYVVVAGMWAISLVASPIWLRYYRFGPLEWGWRSLTYWKLQPMRLKLSAVPVEAASIPAA
jgi:uncharacterized protein